jgi:hypothetical protein
MRRSLMEALRRVAYVNRKERVDLWPFPIHGPFALWSPSAVRDDGS